MGVEAAYRRSDAIEKRRRLLQARANFIDTADAGHGDVVQIGKVTR